MTLEQSSPQRSAVTWRSVLLGLGGVLFICGLTPYNDYVVNNTYLVGNFLPIGLLLFFITFVILINAPLRRWWPGQALSGGELTVALGMTLVSCGLPSSGLMRYLPAHLTAFWYHAGTNADYQSVLRELQLPDWIFPDHQGDRSSDPVVANYYFRVPSADDSFATRWIAVPWTAWLAPAMGWGILLACLYGAVLCACVLVRQQWVENERLPFPLASIYVSMIESPEPGRCFNALFRSRAFWIATAAVFAVHSLNALSRYWPAYAPSIPLRYDLNSILADAPWSYVSGSFKAASVFFCVVGITYFLQSTVAFGLFCSFILFQVAGRMTYGIRGAELSDGMTTDFAFGCLLPLVASILWIGRAHWRLIVRQMFRGRRDDEPAGRYLSYPVAGWGLVLCLVGMITWLMVVGVTLVGAVMLVGVMMTLLLVISRIVAETGLVFAQLPIPMGQPWLYLAGSMGEGVSIRTTVKSYFMTSWFHTLFTHDLREAEVVYASHALRTADHAMEQGGSKRNGLAIIICLGLALAIGYFVAGASTLYCEYSYAVTRDAAQESPINAYGVEASARASLNAAIDYRPPGKGSREVHSRWGYFTGGLSVSGLLSALRFRFVGWPLHPLGPLLAFTYPMQRIWFSIAIGWLAKVVVVRLGGSDLYRRMRPMFIGLIIGETAAAACWLVVSLFLNAIGVPYIAIRLLPS